MSAEQTQRPIVVRGTESLPDPRTLSGCDPCVESGQNSLRRVIDSAGRAGK